MPERHPLTRVFHFKVAMNCVKVFGVALAVAMVGKHVKDMLYQKGPRDDDDDDVGGSHIEGHDDAHHLEGLGSRIVRGVGDFRDWLESPAGITSMVIFVIGIGLLGSLRARREQSY